MKFHSSHYSITNTLYGLTASTNLTMINHESRLTCYWFLFAFPQENQDNLKSEFLAEILFGHLKNDGIDGGRTLENITKYNMINTI